MIFAPSRTSIAISCLAMASCWNGLSGLCILSAQEPAKPKTAGPRPPNIIFVLVDDFGWTDLGCYGSKFYETPNIDRLASEGMRFTDAYSACTVCSPTRAAVLTGKYPARLHITDWIAGHQRPFAKLQIPDWTKHLPLEETTLAESLAAAGYVTAHVGKWHLGGEEFAPTKQGFDSNVGGTNAGSPPSYFYPYNGRPNKKKGPPGPPLPGLDYGAREEYLTDRLADEAVQFITRNKDKPFFLYLPHYAVHTPLQAKADLVAKYQAKADPNNPQHNATYAAMLESLDDSMERIMTRLETLKLVENTIIVFTGDNGGLTLNQVTSNAPLRSGKGSAYEGGVRVPLIVRYPALVKAGTTCSTPVMSIDYFPTLLELARVKLSASDKVDGVSIAKLLKDPSAKLDRETLYWHYPHYHPGGATPYGAIRDGDYRLVEFFEDNRVELYNLAAEIGESTDLAAKQPDKRDALLAKLHTWRKSVGAQMPSANPNYDPKQDPEKAGKKAAK